MRVQEEGVMREQLIIMTEKRMFFTMMQGIGKLEIYRKVLVFILE